MCFNKVPERIRTNRLFLNLFSLCRLNLKSHITIKNSCSSLVGVHDCRSWNTTLSIYYISVRFNVTNHWVRLKNFLGLWCLSNNRVHKNTYIGNHSYLPIFTCSLIWKTKLLSKMEATILIIHIFVLPRHRAKRI